MITKKSGGKSGKLVFVKKTGMTGAVQVPVLPPPNLKEMTESLFQFPTQLPRVLKTKKFILARLEGKSTRQANVEAGFPINTLQRHTLETPMAKILLDEMVRDKITDPDVAVRLREMWDARKTMVTTHPKTKERFVTDLGPDFEQQKYAMDKRLALGGYTNGALPENQQAQVVTNIQFVTVKQDVIQPVEEK